MKAPSCLRPGSPAPKEAAAGGSRQFTAPRSEPGEGRWGAESEPDREQVTFYFPLLVENGEQKLKYVPGAKALNFARPPHQLYHN